MKTSGVSESHIILDIGNSLTKIALFTDKEIVKIETTRTEDVEATLAAVLEMQEKDVTQVVIASVVPSVTEKLYDLLLRRQGNSPFIIRHTSHFPISIEYETPQTLGIDRICNAVAAAEYKHFPCAVVDFGTAITIDILSDEGIFIGGAILPGIHSLQKALLGGTAQLPDFPFLFPMKSIGYDTTTSLQSGIMFGVVEMIDGMIIRMNREVKNDFREVLATGGFAKAVASQSRQINRIHKYLTLEGANIIYNYNTEQK